MQTTNSAIFAISSNSDHRSFSTVGNTAFVALKVAFSRVQNHVGPGTESPERGLRTPGGAMGWS